MPSIETLRALTKLRASEVELARRCMIAVLKGPWIPNKNHISTRMGVTQDELIDAVEFLKGDDLGNDPPHNLLISMSASVGEVGFAFRFSLEEWAQWIGAPRDEVSTLLHKLKELRNAQYCRFPERE